MAESRWLRWIGPGVVALGAVGLIASTTLGAGDRPWAPPRLRRAARRRDRRGSSASSAAPADMRAEAWFRIGPACSIGDGALRGQRLAVGIGDGTRHEPVGDLPPESFAERAVRPDRPGRHRTTAPPRGSRRCDVGDRLLWHARDRA